MSFEPFSEQFAAGERVPIRHALDCPAVSVVVPCFNEEANLPVLVERVRAVCEQAVSGSYELVLVNDGSKDRTWPVICQLADRFDYITGVNLSRNYGHQLALSAGLRICKGDAVLVLDADLQDPPELLPAMLEKMQQGYDVVYGQRMRRAGETVFKRASASLFYRVLDRLVDVHIPTDTGDFRLMSRRVVDQLNAMPERYRFVRGMVSWVGFSQIALPYEREARFAGESNYPLFKMLSFAVDAITSFSIQPLRLTAYMGILSGFVGLLTIGWVLVSHLTGNTVTGWASIVGLVLIIGSIQLLMLGIFGEYLGRMYLESKSRPLFIVQEIRAGRGPADLTPRLQRRRRSKTVQSDI